MSIRPLLATKNYLCKSVRSVGELNNFPTDYTDFHRLLTPSEFFSVRHSEYCCLQQDNLCKSVRSVGD